MKVNLLDFETAVERVIGGLKKQNNLMGEHDRKARHPLMKETARAVTDDLQK